MPTKDDPTFVGVDLGWKINPGHQSTGLCTIRGDELVDFATVRTNQEIVQYVLSQSGDFLGVDAPLVVPNNDGERPVETGVKRAGYSAFPANRNRFHRVYGGIRGEELVSEFEAAGYQLAMDTSGEQSVIEVYPRLTIQSLLGAVPRYKRGKKADIANRLSRLWDSTRDALPEFEFGAHAELVPADPDETTKAYLKGVGDLIDAFYSAYVLKFDLEEPGRTTVFGDHRSGSILAGTN